MTFGEKLKTLRFDKRMSQDEFAAILGTSKQVVSRYELGQNSPKIQTLSSWCDILGVDISSMVRDEDEIKYISRSKEKEESNVVFIDFQKTRMIPLYESASAGFGIVANPTIVDYIPVIVQCDEEADNTICVKVSGDSMYPKIEDGDTIQVRKQDSVDSGSIAVVLVDGEDALVKKVTYGADWIELHSINPEYQTKRFDGADVQRIRVVGLVRKIIKDV